ncbi:uncharacterized protein LOC122539664 [Chiloscyllium plagiosum]|uniref:uncharacterized protein LOC122539664 n=1 Tax=Chiloscyllium plagiosum TaxID=36176 RepID=UPI001CB8425E|nr:uncharacterized protein LOC122539664 [Chiloscyllium plagiosum]
MKTELHSLQLTFLSAQKAEIDKSLAELTKLPKDKRLLFHNTFLEILGSSDNLPDIETMFDQMCESLQPDLQILDLMEDKDAARVEKLLDLLGIRKADPPGQSLTFTPGQNEVIKTVAILIQSLNELNPDILPDLAASVKMKIIPTLLKLLEKIEKRYFNPFPIRLVDEAGNMQKPEETLETLALQLTDSELLTSQKILKEFGVDLKRAKSTITHHCDNGQKAMLFHIFSSLYILSACAE